MQNAWTSRTPDGSRPEDTQEVRWPPDRLVIRQWAVGRGSL